MLSRLLQSTSYSDALFSICSYTAITKQLNQCQICTVEGAIAANRMVKPGADLYSYVSYSKLNLEDLASNWKHLFNTGISQHGP